MMFYYIDITHPLLGKQRHIVEPIADGGVRSFPLTDDNPNMVSYEAWVAAGNTPEEWIEE
jgi:hypothetical protein